MDKHWDAFRYLLDSEFWSALWQDFNEDDCFGMAAQLSFFFLLAFFPFLIFLGYMISFAPLDPGLLGKILLEFHQFLPEDTYAAVDKIVFDIISVESSGILSLGIVLAWWWASVGFRAIGRVLNRAHAIKDTRSYWRVQLSAMGVAMLASLFVISSGVLLFFGDWFIEILLSRITIEPYSSFHSHLRAIYSSSRWVLIFTFLNIGIETIYFAAPARWLPWSFLSPGGFIATLGCVLGSRIFAIYVNQMAHYQTYQKLYGSLATLILLMIWFYISSVFLLIGGEINSTVHLSRLAKEGRKKT